jgi:hypothetical protein
MTVKDSPQKKRFPGRFCSERGCEVRPDRRGLCTLHLEEYLARPRPGLRGTRGRKDALPYPREPKP